MSHRELYGMYSQCGTCEIVEGEARGFFYVHFDADEMLQDYRKTNIIML